MRVGILGGTRDDETHLARIAARFVDACQVFRLVEAAVGSTIAGATALEPRAAAAEHLPRPHTLVFHALERPDLAISLLRAVREDPCFARVSAVLALRADSTATIDLPAGFDDFILYPFSAEELELRIAALQRRRSDGARGPTLAGVGFDVDHAGRSVLLDGRRVQLTAREFALWSYFAQWQGHVLSREHLLARVWGSQYSGGRRTVDIHVRRLRAKLGVRFPLETLRGSGYRLSPDGFDQESPQGPETLSKAS